MGYYSAVVSVLAVAAVASASISDNNLDGGDRGVLIPMLAPPQDSQTNPNVGPYYPVVVLLARQNPFQYYREPEATSMDNNSEKKLEDQDKLSTGILNREKRHKFGYGGGGGGRGCGKCGGGGNYGGGGGQSGSFSSSSATASSSSGSYGYGKR